jgi:hypothetical protein
VTLGSRIQLGGSVLAGVALAGALLAGCGASGPPTVEFTSAAGTVRTGPAQYCDLAVTQCANHPDAIVKLAVPPGQPLRINVSGELASAPWIVVFSYRTATEDSVGGRSDLFQPNKRTEYQLVLPDPADQLLTAQVQEFGGDPNSEQDGERSFPIRGSWVLATS